MMSALMLIPVVAQAGNMYVFKDKKGNVLLTNVVDKKKQPKGKGFQAYNKKVKVTWYKDTNVHAYKDWGKTEASVLPSYSKNRSRFDHLIVASARRHNLDPGLMKAIMHTESGFNPRARSPVGAQGLMQLMPATGKDHGVRNPWDPAQNIEGAAKYLKYLTKLFKGDKRLILAGYNAGQGNVLKYGGIPPFKETQNYVRKVLSRYNKLYRNRVSGKGGSYSASSSNGVSYITPKAQATATLSTSNSGGMRYSQSNQKWQNRAMQQRGNTSYEDSAFAALKKPLK